MSSSDGQAEAFASNPDDGRAFEALEERHFLDGEWQALAALYPQRLAAPSLEGLSAADRARVQFRLAQVLDHVDDLIARARLARLRAQVLEGEQCGDEVAGAWAEVARCDTRCAPAALAQARLLRAAHPEGEPSDADDLSARRCDEPAARRLLARAVGSWARRVAGKA